MSNTKFTHHTVPDEHTKTSVLNETDDIIISPEDKSVHMEVSMPQKSETVAGYSFLPGELKTIKILFFLIGYAGIVNWPTTTNCIQTVYATVYNNPAGANTMLLPYLICSTLFGVIRVYFKHIKLWATTLGVFLLFFTNLAIPLTVQWAPLESGPALLHTIIAFVGIGVSLVMGNFSAYGILMPYNFFGLIVAGNGLAGLFAFLLWQFLIRVPFDSSIVADVQASLWVYYGFNMLSIVLLAGIYIYLLKKPWFKGSIQIFNETCNIKIDEKDLISDSKIKKSSGLDLEVKKHVGVRSFMKMMKYPAPFMLLSGLSFFITYAIFPNIGPYAWTASYDNRSLLVGIYQVLDLIGRYLPNIGKNFLIPIKISIIAIFLRFVFFPIWIVMAQVETAATANVILQIFLMICFAVLSGYLTVLPVIHVARDLKSVAEGGFLGLVTFAAIQLWLCLGIAASNILILIFNVQS